MSRFEDDRRAVLRAMGAAALAAAVGPACAARSGSRRTDLAGAPLARRRFARVRVAPDRVIRTVVGLRPYRPSGFVVRGEKVGGKVIVHNYGHGGGGITLSWGTAHLAMEEALETEHRRCAVLGCGVVGLATARLMQRQGWEVTIYAKALPPHTTSNVAAGQWSPFSVFDSSRASVAFDAQFQRASRLAYRYYQDLVGKYYGVRWISNYSISNEPFGSGGLLQRLPDLYPEVRELQPSEHVFDGRYVRHYTTMLVEPSTYLNAVLRDFLLARGRLVVREFADVASVLSLEEPVVMNCTGLGAKALFGDDELTPVKGQLTVLLPQPEVDYIAIFGGGLYMMPRSDGILLGGTRERGVWSLAPNEEARERILAGHAKFFGAMGSA